MHLISTMFSALYMFITPNLINNVNCAMEAKIVGGETARIEEFPHSAYLGIKCEIKATAEVHTWVCGSSIINQRLLLTAAHCLAECSPKSWVAIYLGHVERKKGLRTNAASYVVHENYYPDTTINDIGLVKMKTVLRFNTKINRVVLMQEPPYREKARVAGWGIIDDEKKIFGTNLNYIDQHIWDMEDCLELLKGIPRGTFCASNDDENKYASGGDSGNALIVRGNIQIGLVSYKKPETSNNVVVYTDVGYFYQWIKDTVPRLYCDNA